MDKDRLIDLINSLGESERKKYVKFSEITGIKKDTVRNLCRGQQKFNDEHFIAITEAFPQYKMWFAFGEIYPEIGQVSPDLDETCNHYGKTGTDTE